MPSDSFKHENPSGDPDMDVLLEIVSILRERRRERGLTLRDLTGKMGIAYSYLSRENGVRVQNLTEIPAPLRSVHAKESPY